MKDPKARHLKEAIDRLEPLQPLIFGEQKVVLAASPEFYVEPPRSPLERLKASLLYSSESKKVLLTGHLGAGKSTELNRLAEDVEIRERFVVVKYNIQDVMNPIDSEALYIDFLLSFCSVLFTQTSQELLPEGVIKEAQRWIEGTTEGQKDLLKLQEEEILGPKPWDKILGFFSNVTMVLLKELNTRSLLQKQVERNLTALIKLINFVIDGIQRQLAQSDRELLVIIDDLEKIPDLNRSRELFVDAAEFMRSPTCKVIYTLPSALYYSRDLRTVIERIGEPYFLQNIALSDRTGRDNRQGYTLMEEFIGKRLDLSLIEPDARQVAIRASGGVVRDLVRILQKSVIEALSLKEPTITQEHVDAVVISLRNEFDRILNASHYQVIGQVIADQSPEDKQTVMELYYLRVLLEYENGERWNRIHPIAEPLYRKYGVTKPQGE